jgi:hypothetical protein
VYPSAWLRDHLSAGSFFSPEPVEGLGVYLSTKAQGMPSDFQRLKPRGCHSPELVEGLRVKEKAHLTPKKAEICQKKDEIGQKLIKK